MEEKPIIEDRKSKSGISTSLLGSCSTLTNTNSSPYISVSNKHKGFYF